MEVERFSCDGIEYETLSGENAKIVRILEGCGSIIIPSEVKNPNSNKYHETMKVTQISQNIIDEQYCLIDEEEYPMESRPFSEISFDDSSAIENVPISFIFKAKEKFFLPKRVKRITCDSLTDLKLPKIYLIKKNNFISIIRNNNIINKFPLELNRQEYYRACLYIRETVRIVGSGAYCSNQCITKVVFPSSVKVIDDGAFYNCECLETIIFKGKSKLKVIGSRAFLFTAIRSIDFPASVEEIGENAFECSELSLVSFPSNSSLVIIDDHAFNYSKIRSIDFPARLMIICCGAFTGCDELSSISFPKNSKLKYVGDHAFSGTKIKKQFVFPKRAKKSLTAFGNSPNY